MTTGERRSGGAALEGLGALLFFGGIAAAALPGRPGKAWLAAAFGAVALGVALAIAARVRARRAARSSPAPAEPPAR